MKELPGAARPYLERYPEPGGPAERIPLLRLPFTIGRSETADHTIYSNKVSKEHAVILPAGGRFAVRDLNSTNGTFVNGQRIEEQVLSDGDIIHVAHVEFCFRQEGIQYEELASAEREVERTKMLPSEQPDSIIRATELVRDLIKTEAVEIVYQPIVDLQTRAVFGHEALGRGAYRALGADPATLLRLAEQCGLVVELSQLFAKSAIERCGVLPAGARLFINVHGQQLAQGPLTPWLSGILPQAPADHPVVVEIAESSVTDAARMAEHKAGFTSLGLEFAYDDFGAGQARLLELIDVPPDYLKLDKNIVQGIDEPGPRQEMVGALLKVATNLGVRVIAEGIETEDVARACRELGCHFGQGYLFGRPA